MSKSLPQLIRDLSVSNTDHEHRIESLEKKLEFLAYKYAAPSTQNGRRLPPTERPQVLKELNLGRDPAGA